MTGCIGSQQFPFPLCLSLPLVMMILCTDTCTMTTRIDGTTMCIFMHVGTFIIRQICMTYIEGWTDTWNLQGRSREHILYKHEGAKLKTERQVVDYKFLQTSTTFQARSMKNIVSTDLCMYCETFQDRSVQHRSLGENFPQTQFLAYNTALKTPI